MTIRISIITPTLNADKTLGHCLESVQQQHIQVEHIVVDGGSTDTTPALLQHHSKHLAKSISEKDQGLYDAMNKGIKLATGDVIGFLHSDDFYPSPDILTLVTQVFQDDDIEACYGDLLYVDDQHPQTIRRRWRAGPFKSTRQFYWGWMPPHPTFFVRKYIYERHGSFNLALGTAADYELMLRFMVKHQIPTQYIPRTMVHMRTGGISNVSLRNRLVANTMDRKAWQVNGLTPCWWTLWCKPLRKVGQWIFIK